MALYHEAFVNGYPNGRGPTWYAVDLKPIFLTQLRAPMQGISIKCLFFSDDGLIFKLE